MERGTTGYSQSGLHSPISPASNNPDSEDISAEHAPVPQFPSNFPTSSTPTSEYGVYPISARSSSFPEHIQRQYHPSSNHSGNSGGMAQSTSPSMSLQDGARTGHPNPQVKSDQDVPIDPSIAASSPTYPPQHGQYSPYPPQQDMTHGYPGHPQSAMYTQPRPDWGGYAGHPQHPMQGGYQVTGASTPTSAAPAGRPGQVSQLSSLASRLSIQIPDVHSQQGFSPQQGPQHTNASAFAPEPNLRAYGYMSANASLQTVSPYSAGYAFQPSSVVSLGAIEIAHGESVQVNLILTIIFP